MAGHGISHAAPMQHPDPHRDHAPELCTERHRSTRGGVAVCGCCLLSGLTGGQGGTRFCAQGLPSVKDLPCIETTELQVCTLSQLLKYN